MKTTAPNITTVPFSMLVATDEINARSGTSKDGIDELVASIKAKGLIQPLAVRPFGVTDKYEVIDGRRRFTAIGKLVKAKVLSKSFEVPVLVRDEDDAGALETSLMANTVRLPMHPVDQHEVFARIVEAGGNESEIASRFGIAERTVKQRLALGRLSPVVRKAWKDGKLDTTAAQAFTLHADHDVQEAAYTRLAKAGRYHGLSEYAVRRELAQDRAPIDQCIALAFVGEDAYLAAGGTIAESLFDEDRYVEDMALVKTLARAKLQAKCAELVAEGWAWAAVEDDLPDDSYSWDEVETDDDGKRTPAQMAVSGVIVTLGWDGKIYLQAGVIKPDGTEPVRVKIGAGTTDWERRERGEDGEGYADAANDLPSATGGEEEEAGPFDVSNALHLSLTEAQTIVASAVLAGDPLLAMRAAIAGLSSSSWSSPVKLRTDGYQRSSGYDQSFQVAFQNTWDWTLLDLAQQLAALVAGALDMRDYSTHGKRDSDEALIAAMNPATYLDAMREAFLAEDYFNRASAAVARAALAEMGEVIGTGAKKAELALAAARAAKNTGWLPPELRHPGYALIPKKHRAKMAAAEQGEAA